MDNLGKCDLSLAASTGRNNILVVDFRHGNPLPSATGEGSFTYNGGGGDPSGSEVGLDLHRGEFDNETHDALSSSSGRITLEVDGVSSTISYDDLGPRGIYDAVAATNYTFNNLGDLTAPVVVKDSALSLWIANTRALWISVPGSFIDTHVTRKQNITINAGSSAVDGSVVVDYRSTYPPSSFPELEILTIVTSDGERSARLLGLPPNVVTTLRQGADDDQATVAVGGLNQADGATLDGGGGANTLTIDASGGWLAPERFSAAPGGSTVVDAPVPGGPIIYSNYQQVLVTNLASSPVGPAAEVFRAVQDKAFVDVVVGRFFSFAPGAKASDFDATIDWGDGSPLSPGKVIQPGGLALRSSSWALTSTRAPGPRRTRRPAKRPRPAP